MEHTSEAIALLEYMIHHNEHHRDELLELADQLDEKSQALIQEAIQYFNQGNEKLKEALAGEK